MIRIVLIAAVLFASWPASAKTLTRPETVLKTEAPPLSMLLTTYKHYTSILGGYADVQGFKQPYERLATVVHEMIHIDSAKHGGFWINGNEYLRPYVTDAAYWPRLKNQDILPRLSNGPIANQYARNAPANSLANCIDEINAYTHVIGFIGSHEPGSLGKQIAALKGHIEMVAVYLDETQKRGDKLSPEALTVVNRTIDYAKKAIERLAI